MISYYEQKEILSNFPTNIKLSYENIIHKKVYNSDIIFAIPKGKKCFVWFTEYNGKDVCFLMEISENKKIKNIKNINVKYNKELVYNTIIYGTLFYNSDCRFFSIENVFYYKGQDITYFNWLNKISIFKTLLKHDLYNLNNSFLFFGMPIFGTNYDELLVKLKNNNYKIDNIQFLLFNKYNSYLFTPYNQIQINNNIQKIHNDNTIQKIHNDNTSHTNNKLNKNTDKQENTKIFDKQIFNNRFKREQIFCIRPSIQNDIYYLYCLNDKKDEIFYQTALIPDYNTSVMMNNLFRNIKENYNLDTLEESDDENEFENENEDRFVFLERSYNMMCQFNYKFKKWVPIKITNNKEIVKQKELFTL